MLTRATLNEILSHNCFAVVKPPLPKITKQTNNANDWSLKICHPLPSQRMTAQRVIDIIATVLSA